MCLRELFLSLLLLLLTQILQIAKCEQQHFRFLKITNFNLITLLSRHSSYQILIGGNLRR